MKLLYNNGDSTLGEKNQGSAKQIQVQSVQDSPRSPDVAPFDFTLFGLIKTNNKTREKFIFKTRNGNAIIPSTLMENVFHRWYFQVVSLLKKRVNSNGVYTEKYA